MRRKIIILLLAVLASSLLWRHQAWGYGETHRLINLKIYTESSLDEYFHFELGTPVDSDGRISQTYQG